MSTITKDHVSETHDVMEENDLPEGWEATTMGQVADVIGGGTPSTSDPANFSENGHPWITPADLSGFGGIWIQHGRRGLSEKGLKTSSATMMPKGTVLMSSRAPIGYVAVAANPILTNQGFKSFVLPPGVTPEYCYYWLKHMKPHLEQMGSGSTFLEISGSRAREIPFRLAPTKEQRRIAAKVEELLVQVNVARTRLAKVSQILKRFRQAVLAAACSEGESTSLSEVLLGLKYGTSQKCTHESAGAPVLRIPNIGDGSVKLDDLKYAKLPSKELAALRLAPGDILMIRSNGSVSLVGKTALVSEKEAGFAYAGYLVRLRANVNRVLPEYLNLALRTHSVREQVEIPARSTSGVHNINSTEVLRLQINLPDPDVQKAAVRRVEALFKLADSTERSVEKATKRADKLTQAILAKAFRGELVPTEAELARREGREYERASKLLARIKANRENTGRSERSRRKPRQVRGNAT